MGTRFSWTRIVVCLLLVAPLAAQTAATLTGTVEDATGAVLVGAKVTATHTETGAVRATLTGADGRFTLPGLPVGHYDLRVEYAGFRPLVQQGIRVGVAETSVQRLRLELGPVDQEVKVTGSSPLVETQSAELSYLVSERFIRELPLNGRNVTDLALLQPGVVAFPHRDGGSVVAHGLGTSINGQDPRSNVYLLDGTPQNDFTNGPAGSAASTALGVETIREFRVESSTYSAEFGRNFGGQINALTRSGTNDLRGSAFWYHRNDNMDARNFFDPARKPEFKRNQMGGTLGGPIFRDRSFFFLGYESLRERLGRTIVSFVPDNNARAGMLPNTAAPCGPLVAVAINANVQPYLNEMPVANGPLVLDTAGCPTGLANFSFPFKQTIDQDFGQARYDHNIGTRGQIFFRYTYDGAEQQLPTDFPQFPRAFLSRNQFFTAEYQHIQSAETLHTFRFGFSRTRIGQAVEANTSQPLAPFIAGRPFMGDIDVGGMPRFGPQSSVSVQLVQNTFQHEYGFTHSRGRHLLKAGMLVERYQDNMVNPTFSLGIFTFSNLRSFLLGTPLRFIGLPPNGALDRYWRFTLFGFYVQDNIRLTSRLTLNAGLRYEFTTMPRDIHGRDSALINLTDATPTVGQLFSGPPRKNIMPRVGLVWDPFGNGKTSVRAGYGLFFNTNNQQNLIVTVTNPPATPRVIIAPPTVPAFPQPNLAAGASNSIRPIQWDLQNPNVHMWNLSVQQNVGWDTVVMLGYAGSRGVHLLRSGDWNIATPTIQPDGSVFFPAGTPRRNPNWSTIELKSSDGNSWYNALLFEIRKRFGHGFFAQSSYTFSRNIDTTQASTFFSDATNGTTSAMPEFPGLSYNKGLADFHAKHNWVLNFVWQVPWAKNLDGGAAKAILDGWQFAGIANVRSGSPLTVFVSSNVSRSLWSPSLGPGLGFDRGNLVSGFTSETAVQGRWDQWFYPAAFASPAAGRLGNTGRGQFIGPNLRTFDLSLAKFTPVSAWGRETSVQFRVEAFNLFNRTNFGVPSLLVGTPTFGRIRQTVTSSRQIQLGLRLQF